jgi:hypothetical protein
MAIFLILAGIVGLIYGLLNILESVRRRALLVTKKGAEVVETLKTYDPVAQWNDPE